MKDDYKPFWSATYARSAATARDMFFIRVFLMKTIAAMIKNKTDGSPNANAVAGIPVPPKNGESPVLTVEEISLSAVSSSVSLSFAPYSYQG